MRILVYCAITAILLSGCTSAHKTGITAQDDLSVILPTTTDIETSSSLIGSTMTFSDRNIRLKGNDENGITLLDIRDSNHFDIRDLSAFAITLYRSHLQRKLKTGETLSDLDLALLKFVWRTQNEALKTYTLKAYSAITETPIPTGTPSAIKADAKPDKSSIFQQTTDECLNKAVATFFKNKNPMSNRIEDWSSGFHSLTSETRLADIDSILASNKRIVDNTQWRQYFTAGAVLIAAGSLGGLATDQIERHWGPLGLGENRTLREYKKYSVPKETASRQWRNLFKSVSYYVSDSGQIYDDTATYLSKTTDSHSKRQIEDFRLIMTDDLDDTLSKFRAVYCDYPFAVACCRTYIMVQSRKGIFNDDEDEMKQDALDLTIYVSNSDMLKQISSPYSAALYTDTLALLKSELSAKEWTTLLTTCKLFEYNGVVFAQSLLKENTLTGSN